MTKMKDVRNKLKKKIDEWSPWKLVALLGSYVLVKYSIYLGILVGFLYIGKAIL